MLRRSGFSLALGALLFVAGCTTNPATGRTHIAPLMSPEQEARAGADAHPKILETYGGVYGDERVGAYVAKVTSRIAKGSDRPDIAYRVTVLDSPIVNAFALPGGYVYVTRGLLSLVDDEAELAGVLGHEIGHVVARHSAQRQTAALGASVVGAVLGAVVGSSAVNQAVSMGGQGLLASYSRDQEFEADTIGVRYLARAGYDPYAEADFLQTMDAQEQLSVLVSRQKQSGSGMDWLASHPATPDRVAAARAHADETGMQPGTGDRQRESFMRAIDGLIYGDSPENGIVRGQMFMHPKLRIAFSVPKDFVMTNTAKAVIAQGPGKTVVKFDSGQKAPGTDIATYLTSVWAKGVELQGLQRFTINGMNAAASAAVVGEYNAQLVAIEAEPGTVYRFLMGTKPEVGTRYNAALRDVAMSFRRLSEAEARAVKPLRIRIAAVQPGDTVATLASRMAFSDYKVERFRVLNGLGQGRQLKPGMLVKIVTD